MYSRIEQVTISDTMDFSLLKKRTTNKEKELDRIKYVGWTGIVGISVNS